MAQPLVEVGAVVTVLPLVVARTRRIWLSSGLVLLLPLLSVVALRHLLLIANSSLGP